RAGLPPEVGRGFGSLACGGRGRKSRDALEDHGSPACVHPHQQHQSDVAGGFPRANNRRGSRMGSCFGWDGDQTMKDNQHRGPLSKEAFMERLTREGSARYHDNHPFHKLMHEGNLTKVQLQQWVLNRYYYQTRIPIKDALIVSKSEDPNFRRI